MEALSDDSKSVTPQDKLTQAIAYKQEGNNCYKQKIFRKAIGNYHKALLYVKAIDADAKDNGFKNLLEIGGIQKPDFKGSEVNRQLLQETQAVKIDCYNNLSACLLQQPSGNMKQVITYCNNVIEICPKNTKAWFRKGQAYFRLKDIQNAMDCFRTAAECAEQKDPEIFKYITLCEKEFKSYEEKEKHFCKDMFARMKM